jgi:two-component sensor histidine kinase
MLVVLPILSLLMILITYRNNRRFLGPLSRKITEINRGAPRRERSSELNTGIYELDALHSYYTGEIERQERMNERLQEEKERAERSLRQREVLLRETHHRVKNNLNIIASLLRLQADSLEDEQIRRYFNETQNRVNSMSLIHEKLYRQDLAGLDFRQYLEDLVAQLIDTYSRPGRRIRTYFDVPDLEMSLDTAIPLGLIVNELLTNSLEHGLQDAEEGTVSISIEPQEEGYLLTVRDDGSGLPDGFDAASASSLGLSLVSTLAAQLQGDFSLESDGGTAARLRFRNIEKWTEP